MLLRRLRAVLVTALIWAVLWIPLSLAAGVIRYYRAPRYDLITDINVPSPRPPALPIILGEASWWAAWAAVVGAIFAVILIVGERRRTISEIRPWRFACWGAVAAVGLPVSLVIGYVVAEGPVTVTWDLPVLIVLTGIFGAACAAGMLRIARRAN